MFGIGERTLKLLLKYFEEHSEIEEVVIYGSRAKGTEKPGSDIDLAILTNVSPDLSGHIKTDLEELSTPYFFDVTDMHHLQYVPLREHIERVGKILYKRTRKKNGTEIE